MKGLRGMGKIWSHFKTITHHKFLVMQGCFRVGLYLQGICHDLSKYSPSEFWLSAKYYQGYRSPLNAEREDTGVSTVWLHHKGRNKHHYEYWMDSSLDPALKGILVPVPMPKRYIAEMIMDRIAASKVYEGDKYTDGSALAYFAKDPDHRGMHPETAATLQYYLEMLAEKGEKETFRCVKEDLVTGKK